MSSILLDSPTDMEMYLAHVSSLVETIEFWPAFQNFEYLLLDLALSCEGISKIKPFLIGRTTI